MTEEKITDVKRKVNELMEGKPQIETPSMIQEARDLKDQLSKLKDEIKSEREKLDNVHAQALLGGKSLLGQQIEKSNEEIAAETAREILKIYGK